MSEENVEIVRSICTPWASGDFRSIEWADDDIEFVREDKIARKGVNAMVG